MTPGRCRCPLASRPSQPTALAGGAGGLGLHGRRGVPGPIPHPPASLSSASRLLSQVTVKGTSFVMLSPGPGRCSPAALAWSLAEGKRVQTVSLWKAGRISCRPQGNRLPSPDGIFSPQSWEGVYEQEAGGFHRSSQQHCPARSLNGRGCGFGEMSPLSCLVVEQGEKKSSGEQGQLRAGSPSGLEAAPPPPSPGGDLLPLSPDLALPADSSSFLSRVGENPREGPGFSFKVKIAIDYCRLVFFREPQSRWGWHPVSLPSAAQDLPVAGSQGNRSLVPVGNTSPGGGVTRPSLVSPPCWKPQGPAFPESVL